MEVFYIVSHCNFVDYCILIKEYVLKTENKYVNVIKTYVQGIPLKNGRRYHGN